MIGNNIDVRAAKKKKALKSEIMGLKSAVENREKSIDHYRALVEVHSKTLHRQSKRNKRLVALLRECLMQLDSGGSPYTDEAADLATRIEREL